MSEKREQDAADLIAIARRMARRDDTPRQIIILLQHRGSREVFEAAAELCQSPHISDRVLGVQILAQLGVPERSFPVETTALLLVMLEREPDPVMLNNLGIAFGHLRSVEAIAPLAQLKNHPHEGVRLGVVHGLMCQEDELAIATLIELSEDQSIPVRNWATFALGSMIETNSPEIRQALWARIEAEKPYISEDDFYEIYGEALVGLARRKDTGILNLLKAELDSDSIGDLLLEACEELSNEELYPTLLKAQQWLDDRHALQCALENCKPGSSFAQ